jgi:hypothetical protein
MGTIRVHTSTGDISIRYELKMNAMQATIVVSTFSTNIFRRIVENISDQGSIMFGLKPASTMSINSSVL